MPLPTSPDDGATRRRIMVQAAAAAAALGVALRPRAAQAKLAPAEIGYQSTPKGAQRCELCMNWRAPAACILVSGTISPSGWCGLFARRG